MNSDLISLSALRKEIKLQKSYGGMIQQRDYGTGFVISLSILEGKLADFPTVDAEPVRHGRWEKSGIPGYVGCNQCDNAYISSDWLDDGKWKFCPNCGAKMDMDGGTENDKAASEE